MNLPANKPKTTYNDPMAVAADALDVACSQVDEAEDIDTRLAAFFDDSKMQLGDEVDKRIAFDRWCAIQTEAAKEAVAFYKARIEMIEEAKRKRRAATQAVLEAKPDLPYRGKLGKVWLQASEPAVEYVFGDKHVDPAIIQNFGIPDEYVLSEIVYKIDHAKLKADLKAGKTVGWAVLKQKVGIRFPSLRKPKMQIEGDDE